MSNFTGGVLYISSVAFVYWLFSRFGLSGATGVLVVILFADFVLRAIYDIIIGIMEKLGVKEKFKEKATDKKYIDPYATHFSILGFLCGMLFLILIISGLFGYEMY